MIEGYCGEEVNPEPSFKIVPSNFFRLRHSLIRELTEVISSPVLIFVYVVLKFMRMSIRNRKSIAAFNTIKRIESALYVFTIT